MNIKILLSKMITLKPKIVNLVEPIQLDTNKVRELGLKRSYLVLMVIWSFSAVNEAL